MKNDALAARLRAIFLTELEEQVVALNADLLALEGEPEHPERLDSVFRILHTLKGAAHAAAVPQVENVCHVLETVLAQAREGRHVLGVEDFTHLFAAADALAEAGKLLKEGKDLGNSSLASLDSIGREAWRGTSPGIRQRSTEPLVASVPEALSPSPGDPGPEGPNRPRQRAGTPPTPTGQGTGQIRLDAEKLDSLVASASELLVTAGHIAARPPEIERLHEMATQWRAGWQRTAQRLRRLARGDEAGGVVRTAVEEIDQHLRFFVEESGRLAAAGASDSRALSQIVGKMGEGVRSLRLRPFSDACAALPRAVRDLAAASGKEVRLVVSGGEVEVDRAVVDMLRDPLLHLVRNAVDHGIESPEERGRASKARTGTVTVSATLDRQRLRVTVSDDGRGLDLPAIRAQLERRGLEVPREERELIATLFEPGFSTREEPTKISGRGVGLDAVRTALERMRGSVEVTATTGIGSSFELECPPSLSTMRAVLVTVGSQVLAIPSARVERLLRVRRDEIRRAEGREVILAGDLPLPLVPLARLLGPPLPDPPDSEHLSIVHLRIGERGLALAVDELLAEEEVVVRPVERLRNPPPYLGGAALLGTGRVALVLNAASLLASGLEGVTPTLARQPSRSAIPAPKRILVVDDSLTTRSLEQSILEAEGFEVLGAVDGEEGWRLLQEHAIDLVVSDVDMPRMDGFELCRAVRGSRRLADIPIILVTGQEAPEHREKGLEAGADAYLPKSSFDQQGLLDTIRQLLG